MINGLKEIRKRLGLSEKQMAALLDTKEKQIKIFENDIDKIDNNFLGRVCNICNIDKESFLSNNIDIIMIKKKLDVSIYKNIFNAYVENLKYYFGNKHVYVLSKHKRKGKFGEIFNILFKSSKKSVINEMKYFSPSYLILDNNIKLLISFEKNIMVIQELKNIENHQQFEWGNYVYKSANEVKF